MCCRRRIHQSAGLTTQLAIYASGEIIKAGDGCEKNQNQCGSMLTAPNGWRWMFEYDWHGATYGFDIVATSGVTRETDWRSCRLRDCRQPS